MDYVSLISGLVERGKISDLVNGIVLFAIVWKFVKPEIARQVDSVKVEMAKQMGSVREEINALSKIVSELSGALKSLEHTNEKRFNNLEMRVDRIESEKNP